MEINIFYVLWATFNTISNQVMLKIQSSPDNNMEKTLSESAIKWNGYTVVISGWIFISLQWNLIIIRFCEKVLHFSKE